MGFYVFLAMESLKIKFDKKVDYDLFLFRSIRESPNRVIQRKNLIWSSTILALKTGVNSIKVV